MTTLLHIDSSPLYGRSISRELSKAFVERWKSAHPDSNVIERDLYATPISPVDAKWVDAAFTPQEHRTPEQKIALTLSDTLLAELEQADDYLIGVPMHNLGVPAALKLWIDQIVRVGKTFAYVDGARKGLLLNKRVTFVVASGGIYDAQAQTASFDFVEPYLRTIFAFVGVVDSTFIRAGGAAVLNHGGDRNAFLAPHLEAVQAHALRE
jgi:FMN-dependent NADH-azoreductase